MKTCDKIPGGLFDISEKIMAYFSIESLRSGHTFKRSS